MKGINKQRKRVNKTLYVQFDFKMCYFNGNNWCEELRARHRPWGSDLETRVSDPYNFNTDPDPRIRPLNGNIKFCPPKKISNLSSDLFSLEPDLNYLKTQNEVKFLFMFLKWNIIKSKISVLERNNIPMSWVGFC